MTRAPDLNIITEAEYSKRVNQGRYVIKGEVKARGNRKQMHKLYDAQTKTLLCQMDIPLGVHRVLPDGTHKRPTPAQCSKHLRHFTHCIKTQNKLALSCSCPYLPPPVSTLVRGKTRALIIVPFANAQPFFDGVECGSVRRCTFTKEEARIVLRGVVQALRAMHRQGVMHLNLHMYNVQLLYDKKTKVVTPILLNFYLAQETVNTFLGQFDIRKMQKKGNYFCQAPEVTLRAFIKEDMTFAERYQFMVTEENEMKKVAEFKAIIKNCHRVFLEQQNAKKTANALQYINAQKISDDEKNALLVKYKNVVIKVFTVWYEKKDAKHAHQLSRKLSTGLRNHNQTLKNRHPALHKKLHNYVYKQKRFIRYTPKVDIWALGALLLCLRDVPLTLLDLTADNIHPTINRLKTLSNEEKDFLHMTLQMNPAQRPDVDTLMQSTYLQQTPPRSAHVSLGKKVGTKMDHTLSKKEIEI